MTTNAWIDINDTFPPLHTTLMVCSGTATPGQPGAAPVVARLADAWEASEAEGIDVIVWVEDESGEELTFDPTHWRPLPAQAAATA